MTIIHPRIYTQFLSSIIPKFFNLLKMLFWLLGTNFRLRKKAF